MRAARQRRRIVVAAVLGAGFLAGAVFLAVRSWGEGESGQPEKKRVKAHIDASCQSHSGEFRVPEGRSALNLQVIEFQPGKPCPGQSEVENKGYAILDDENRVLYQWSQYREEKPYERGGPLDRLTLKPGRYHLTVAGGAGASLELSFCLK